MKDGREVLYLDCLHKNEHANNRATAPGVWIPKMCGWEGVIDVTHISLDIVLKNDKNN